MIITVDHPLTEEDIVYLGSLGVDRHRPVIEEAGVE